MICAHTHIHTHTGTTASGCAHLGWVFHMLLHPGHLPPSRGRYKLSQTDYISQISSLHCVLIVPVQ